MTKTKPITPTADDVRRILDVCGDDGHGVYKPEAFEGVTPALVAAMTEEIKSDFISPKRTVFGHDGQPIRKLTGVYSLSLLQFCASALKLNYREAFGRGTEARNISTALRDWLK